MSLTGSSWMITQSYTSVLSDRDEHKGKENGMGLALITFGTRVECFQCSVKYRATAYIASSVHNNRRPLMTHLASISPHWWEFPLF